ATVIATADDPRHAVHRTLLQPAFLAAKIKAMEPLLRSWASATLAPLASEGGGPTAQEWLHGFYFRSEKCGL
ncbi:cytochrome P450, partial [Halioglobus sp. HI00S01]|uniref:cytochrome P450 n=1 Tax=Halioglobus sp. HI00S01 TaxID=1822214 RepID=UPI001E569DE3